jgi:hypothetical protein
MFENIFGRKNAAPTAPAARPFEERWAELQDQADLVETTDEVRALTKSVFGLLTELKETGEAEIAKAIGAGPLTEQAITADSRNLVKGDLDDESEPESEPESDPDDDDEDEFDDDGNPLPKSKNSAGSTPDGGAGGSASKVVTATAAPVPNGTMMGLSKGVDEDVDATPLVEALVEHIAQQNLLMEQSNDALSKAVSELTLSRQENTAIYEELTAVRGLVEDGAERSQELAKSIAALAARPVTSGRRAGAFDPLSKSVDGSDSADVGDGLLRQPPLNAPGKDIVISPDEAAQPLRSEIIKSISAHIGSDHHLKHDTGITQELMNDFSAGRLEGEQLEHLLDVAHKEKTGFYNAAPEKD